MSVGSSYRWRGSDIRFGNQIGPDSEEVVCVAADKRYIKAAWSIMEQLLEEDNIESALSGSLEILFNTLKSEAGAIWLLDKETDRLTCMFHIGSVDLSDVTIENGLGIEGVVTKTGRSGLVKDSGSEAQFDGSVYDDNGVVPRTMICVPLNDLHEVIGCVQLVNRTDGGVYDDVNLQFCEQMAALAAMTIDEKGLKVNLKEEKEVLAVLRDVTKEFPSGGEVLKVLKGINLEIYKNEFVIILGEYGCGKTTMMNIVGGMDFLTGGKLIIVGKDFSHPTDAEPVWQTGAKATSGDRRMDIDVITVPPASESVPADRGPTAGIGGRMRRGAEAGQGHGLAAGRRGCGTECEGGSGAFFEEQSLYHRGHCQSPGPHQRQYPGYALCHGSKGRI